ncbi:MAG: Uma2 family endonuclease [Bacteroidota bacterium]|nr:Uma2 family endonuclease [Bacteroidota bacterium]
MGIADKILPHYTYDEWVHWEGKWELIEGFPVAMSPTPIPPHQRAAAELITEFTLALRKSLCKKCKVYDSLDYKIANDTILVPDILIICGEVKKNYLDFAPSLVVEILSPSTALRDRHTKFELYQQQGVKYYLIVDADKKSIEVYMLKDAIYTLQKLNKSFTFHLDNNCSTTPDMSSIFD